VARRRSPGRPGWFRRRNGCSGSRGCRSPAHILANYQGRCRVGCRDTHDGATGPSVAAGVSEPDTRVVAFLRALWKTSVLTLVLVDRGLSRRPNRAGRFGACPQCRSRTTLSLPSPLSALFASLPFRLGVLAPRPISQRRSYLLTNFDHWTAALGKQAVKMRRYGAWR
jgi:hypothetical protein